MATTVRFGEITKGKYTICFEGHSRNEDISDKSTGASLCAVMSAFARYVENLVEVCGCEYQTNVMPDTYGDIIPYRSVIWTIDGDKTMPRAIEALKHTIYSLAIEYPEYIIVEEV